MWAGLGLLLVPCVLGLKTREELQKDARDRLDSVDAFFVKYVKSADDLVGANQEEMEERIAKSIEFLEKMQRDRASLKHIANPEQSQILTFVDGWLSRCRTFQEEVGDRSKDFTQTKQEWGDFIRSAWDGGLGTLVTFVQTTTSGAGAAGLTALLSLALPLLLR